MPYITQDRRMVFNEYVENLSSLIETPGDLNYLCFLLSKALAKHLGNNYTAHNAVIGALDSCKEEYRRRILNPYEDKKIKIEGDILDE